MFCVNVWYVAAKYLLSVAMGSFVRQLFNDMYFWNINESKAFILFSVLYFFSW